jgi:hypothetical protein
VVRLDHDVIIIGSTNILSGLDHAGGLLEIIKEIEKVTGG